MSMRVEWAEIVREGALREPRFVIAELDLSAGWTFFDRYSGEVRWFSLPASPTLIDKAEELWRKKSGEAGAE